MKVTLSKNKKRACFYTLVGVRNKLNNSVIIPITYYYYLNKV